MQIKNVGVLSPGDMGQAVALRLKARGYEVHTALEGRSARTAELAKAAGLVNAGSVEGVVSACDTVLSILDPAAAVDLAREVADAMRATGRKILFVDCNPIAPQTVREIDGLIRGSGGTFLDGAIIGSPPRGKTKNKLYVSGPSAADLLQIGDDQLRVRVIGERIGDASAVKMCFAATGKGAVALGVEALIAARWLGVEEVLEVELKESQPVLYRWVLNRSVMMPPKAHRWVPEMLEIAKTFEGVGMTPRMLQGAADMFELVATTPLGRESVEQTRDRGRSGAEIVKGLADGTS